MPSSRASNGSSECLKNIRENQWQKLLSPAYRVPNDKRLVMNNQMRPATFCAAITSNHFTPFISCCLGVQAQRQATEKSFVDKPRRRKVRRVIESTLMPSEAQSHFSFIGSDQRPNLEFDELRTTQVRHLSQSWLTWLNMRLT